MGKLSIPDSGSIYIDTNCIIYRVERIDPFLETLVPVFDRAAAGDIALVTSELTLLECLTHPVKRGDTELEHLYRRVLTEAKEIALYPIDRQVIESALILRAQHALRTPDAIHAATALNAGCSTFLTNDRAFERVDGLHIALLHP